MGCGGCRGRSLASLPPRSTPAPRPLTYVEGGRVCNRLRLDRTNLTVTLRDGAAYVDFEARVYELAEFLRKAAACGPDVATIVAEIAAIYDTALRGGTITRLTATHTTPRVSVHYLRIAR